MTADQDGNEWGTTQPDEVTWEGLKIVWENKPDGTRTIKNEEEVLKLARGVDTMTSSNFLSPELEYEAVKRAMKVAEACTWDEVRASASEEWQALDNLVVFVGAPVTNKSKGWGMSVSQIDGFKKKKLTKVMKALTYFREGKFAHEELIKGLGLAMDTAGKDMGATIKPTAKIVLNRRGKKWVNVTQFPAEGTVGWDLTGKLVRTKSEGGNGVSAPHASGA
jgi:hypothetical protein